MNQITLSKTGGTAMPSVLEIRHLDEVLKLQDETRAALPEEHKMFVLPQPASYFEKLLVRESGLMIGLRSSGRLVAQIALMGPLTLDEAIDCNAITRSDVTFHHAAPSETVAIAKSMAVHPDLHGNGCRSICCKRLSRSHWRAASIMFSPRYPSRTDAAGIYSYAMDSASLRRRLTLRTANRVLFCRSPRWFRRALDGER